MLFFKKMDFLDEMGVKPKKYITKSKKTKPSVHVLSEKKFPIRCKGDPKPYFSYSEYLKSHHWIAFRHKVLKRRLKNARRKGKSLRCYCCETPTTNLELHHRTYKRIGHKLPHDVEPVCRGCHQKIHDFINEKKSKAVYSTVFQGTLLRKLSWKKIKNESEVQVKTEKDDFLD
jgi:PP-loop superfamily ATP-utilizing enzyme